MKLHPGWLAAGLLLFVVLACNLGKNSNSNNSNSNSNRAANSSTSNRPANAEVYVEQITMAKDDNGKPGEETSSFAPEDRTVHTTITLNKAKSGTKVKFVWVAADAEGAENQELKSLDYTTKTFENIVYGHLTWPQDWPKGKYRVEIYINGTLDKTIDYTVQ